MTSVSYVVTIYNKTAALPFLVAGLAAQEGDFEREFIFVDDGSTDGSVPLLRRLVAGWPNVTVVEQANSGPAPALNAGFRRAGGDYLKPIDGDDMLLPWATRRLLEAAETTGRAVAFAHSDAPYSLAMQPGDILSERRWRTGPIECCDDMLRRSLQRAQTNPTCWLARAAIVRDSGGCDERVFIQDYSIELRLAARGGFAQLREAVFCSPGEIPGRLSDNQAQILHDMNSALVNFVAEHPGLPRDLVRLGFIRATARAWAWARRRGGKGYASSEFRLACGARLGLMRPTLKNLRGTCIPFAETNAIRVPVTAPPALR